MIFKPVKCPRCGNKADYGIEDRWYAECPRCWLQGMFVAANTLTITLLRWNLLCLSERIKINKAKHNASPFTQFKVGTKPSKIPRDVSILAAHKYGCNSERKEQ